MTPPTTPYLLVIGDDALEEQFYVVLDTLDDVAKMLGEYFAATGVCDVQTGEPVPVPEFHDINGYALALWLCDIADHAELPVFWTVYGPEEIRSPGGQQVVSRLLTGRELADWCKRGGSMVALTRDNPRRPHRYRVQDVITSL